MKYLGKITDDKDLVTKEYVDAYHAPIATKTFTGIIATANSDPAGWLYFGWVKREGYEVPWRIRYKIYGTIAGLSANYKSYYEVEIRGNYNTYYTFDCFNVCNGSYRAIYDHILFCATSAGISNGYGPLLGVRLQSAYNPATTANSRTFQIDILEVEGCEFVFYDSMKLYANVPGTGTTNYVNRYGLNAHDAGHKMYGDANDTTTLQYSTSRPTAGSNGIPGYSIIMMKPDGTFEGLTVGNATTATTSTKNTSGFVLGQMYLYWSSTNLASGSIAATSTIRTVQDWVDLRYTTNCGTTLTAHKMVYLKGTISNGLFYLADTWWTQTLPTSKDNYVYIPVGYCYGNGYSFCFWGWHGAYYHNGTTLVEHNISADTINGHTVAKDVPSDAKFTDTVTTATTGGSGNAVTAITATNGALTVTKGATFLTSHQDISGKADKSATVSTVAYDSTNKKITKTINGTTTDVVTVATLTSGLVPTTRKVNNKALSADITLTASDVGALSEMGYTTIATTSKSISSSTSYSTIKGVSIAAGLHFIQVSCSFPQSSTANRRGGLRLVSGSNTTAIAGMETKLTLSNNGETMAHISGWVQPTSTTTYNFQVFQNSGAALTLELVSRYHTLG